MDKLSENITNWLCCFFTLCYFIGHEGTVKFNVQVFGNHYQNGYAFSIFYFQEDKFSIFSDEAN